MILTTLLSLSVYSYINVPYKWGGNNYDGLDCSGLVLKSLNDVGVTLVDMTSQDIYYWATKKKQFQSCEPNADCVLFFGRNTSNITHIGIAISENFYIEAGGSDRRSLSMTKKQLADRDARVRMKPIKYRSDLVASIKFKY